MSRRDHLVFMMLFYTEAQSEKFVISQCEKILVLFITLLVPVTCILIVFCFDL